MVKIVLVASNRREANILKMVFQQLKWSIRMADANANNYLQFMQYKPEIIMMELPEKFIDQLASIKLIKQNKQLQNIPIICYGNHSDPLQVKTITDTGVNKYFERPLKIGQIYDMIDSFFPERDLFGKSEESLAAVQEEKDKDFEMLLDLNVLGSIKLDIMKKHVGKLMAFPFTISKIVEISGDSSSGAGDLAKVISSDSVISANILKVANSVHFATKDQNIENLQGAIVRIGFEEVKRIALSLGVLNILETQDKSFGFSRLDFWYHSLTTALIAQKIAIGSKHSNPSLVFLSGLLHDFGILLIDEFFESMFEAILRETTDKATFVNRAEDKVVGVNHLEFTTELFEEWNMPDEIRVSITHHLDFNELPEIKEQHKHTAMCIGVANQMARSLGFGRSCDDFIYPVSNEVMKKLKLNSGVRDSYFDKIRADVKMFAGFLGLENKVFPENAAAQKDGKIARLLIIDLERALFSPHMSYLENMEYPIKRALKVEDIENLDETHCTIINACPRTRLADIEPWIAALPNQPTILFNYDNPELVGLDLPKNSKELEPFLDLKMIDLSIQALVTGAELPLFKSGKKILKGEKKKKVEENPNKGE